MLQTGLLIDDLNAVLVPVGRSLLQYTAEAFPWTSAGSEHIRRDVVRLAQRQQQTVQRLTDEIIALGGTPEFGTFPTDYTSLHFVAVSFLMAQIVANQEAVLKTICALGDATRDDRELNQMLWEAAAVEGGILEELKRIKGK